MSRFLSANRSRYLQKVSFQTLLGSNNFGVFGAHNMAPMIFLCHFPQTQALILFQLVMWEVILLPFEGQQFLSLDIFYLLSNKPCVECQNKFLYNFQKSWHQGNPVKWIITEKYYGKKISIFMEYKKLNIIHSFPGFSRPLSDRGTKGAAENAHLISAWWLPYSGPLSRPSGPL